MRGLGGAIHYATPLDFFRQKRDFRKSLRCTRLLRLRPTYRPPAPPHVARCLIDITAISRLLPKSNKDTLQRCALPAESPVSVVRWPGTARDMPALAGQHERPPSSKSKHATSNHIACRAYAKDCCKRLINASYSAEDDERWRAP